MGLISSQQRIVSVYYLVHLGSSMWFMLGGQQTIDDPLSIFLNWSYNLPAIISFGSIHSFATISLDFCMHPLGLTKSNYFFIVHVRYCTQSYWTCREKEKTVACEYNVMQTCSMVGQVPSPLLHFQIVFQRKILFRWGFRRSRPCLFTTWGVCSNLACWCWSYHAYGALHCLHYTSYMSSA